MHPRWPRWTLFSVAALLILGNVVSVTGSGLGCPDWPLCHGRLIPPLQLEAWIEYLHRLAGLITSILLLGNAWIAYRSGVTLYRRLAFAAVGLLFIQIPLGAVVVLLELPPAVIPIHLGIAFVIFALLSLQYLLIRRGEQKLRLTYPYAAVFALLVIVQAMMGALVRHYHASLVCPEFPTCLAGFWFPPSSDPRFHIHLTHRFLAYLLFLLPLPMFRRNVRDAGILTGLLAFQIFLGAWTVLSRVNPVVVSLHYANALMILFWALRMSLTTPRETRNAHPVSPGTAPL